MFSGVGAACAVNAKKPMASRQGMVVWSNRKLSRGNQVGGGEDVTMLGYLRGGERAGWG